MTDRDETTEEPNDGAATGVRDAWGDLTDEQRRGVLAFIDAVDVDGAAERVKDAVTRRDVLAAGGTGLAALTGLGGYGVGRASAGTDQAGQIGTASAPIDFYGEDHFQTVQSGTSGLTTPPTGFVNLGFKDGLWKFKDDTGTEKQIAATDHDSLTGVSINDHHARDHATRHHAGGADALDAGNLSGASGTNGQVLKTDGTTAAWSQSAAGSSLVYTKLDTASDTDGTTTFDKTLTLGGGYDYYVVKVDLAEGSAATQSSIVCRVNGITTADYTTVFTDGTTSSSASVFQLVKGVGISGADQYTGGELWLQTYSASSSHVSAPRFSGGIGTETSMDHGTIASSQSDITSVRVFLNSSSTHFEGTLSGHGVNVQ